jgi:hypothetical protein
MGALRAAELSPYGMAGIGRIFESYRDGAFPPYAEPFDSDDEVAVIHGPPELDWPALSDALVDLRHAYAEACTRGLIAPGTRDALARIAAGLHFTGRTHDAVLGSPAAVGLPSDELAALAGWLATAAPSLKQQDARAVLAALDAWRRMGSPPHEPQFHFEEPSAWQAFVAREEDRARNVLSAAEESVLDIVRFDGTEWDHLRRRALVRVCARRQEGAAGDRAIGEVRRAFDAWRSEHGIASHAALRAWLADNALDEAELARLFEDEARHASWASDLAAIRRAVVDDLRLSGRFAPLLRLAEHKARQLSLMPDAQRKPSMLEAGLLLDGGPGLLPSRGAEAERIRLAFDTQDQLFTAWWRARCAGAAINHNIGI